MYTSLVGWEHIKCEMHQRSCPHPGFLSLTGSCLLGTHRQPQVSPASVWSQQSLPLPMQLRYRAKSKQKIPASLHCNRYPACHHFFTAQGRPAAKPSLALDFCHSSAANHPSCHSSSILGKTLLSSLPLQITVRWNNTPFILVQILLCFGNATTTAFSWEQDS